MSANILKVFCILLAALLFVPTIAVVVQADDTNDDSYDPGKGKPAKPSKPPKDKDNQAPIVTITSPTESAVSGGSLTITVTVQDEDPNPIALIYVDLMPTYNTGNTVVIDVSEWETDSEHFITAVYEDSGGLIGGDDQYLVKL